MAFAWRDLLPELQAVVRAELDEPTRRMLYLTCRAEAAAAPPGRGRVRAKDLFAEAAGLGHLPICQWIFELTKDWRNKEDAAPYRAVLYFDNALFCGHFEVADWALSERLHVSPCCRHNLVVDDCVAALQWLDAQGFWPPTWIDPRASSMPMIKWLCEEKKCNPMPGYLEDLVFDLPAAEERLLYYMKAFPPSKRIIELTTMEALRRRHCAGLHFLLKWYPKELDTAFERMSADFRQRWYPDGLAGTLYEIHE